jgi:hypothetical protein
MLIVAQVAATIVAAASVLGFGRLRLPDGGARGVDWWSRVLISALGVPAFFFYAAWRSQKDPAVRRLALMLGTSVTLLFALRLTPQVAYTTVAWFVIIVLSWFCWLGIWKGGP